MECVIDQVIKSMVVLDKYPEALAQLACLHKIPQDMMVRLACRKNRAEHLAYLKVAGFPDQLWSDVAAAAQDDKNAALEEQHLSFERDHGELIDQNNFQLRYISQLTRDKEALQRQIKEASDGEEDALGINAQAKIYLAKARTMAGSAEFAAATAECTRAVEHSKEAHALISAALEVLDMA